MHVEASPHLHRTVQQIHERGAKAGVTLNPGTPVEALTEILPYVDLVLVMSVNPGFGGQSYIPTSTAKIAKIRRMIDERGLGGQIELQVDGGVAPDTIAEVVGAGATVVVAGLGGVQPQGERGGEHPLAAGGGGDVARVPGRPYIPRRAWVVKPVNTGDLKSPVCGCVGHRVNLLRATAW